MLPFTAVSFLKITQKKSHAWNKLYYSTVAHATMVDIHEGQDVIRVNQVHVQYRFKRPRKWWGKEDEETAILQKKLILEATE